jgi:hypothetical protein
LLNERVEDVGLLLLSVERLDGGDRGCRSFGSGRGFGKDPTFRGEVGEGHGLDDSLDDNDDGDGGEDDEGERPGLVEGESEANEDGRDVGYEVSDVVGRGKSDVVGFATVRRRSRGCL